MREIHTDELKNIELEMLREVDEICKKHKITYYAIGGTLLGAVRHHGFIPWDDDIDIALFEEDYNKLRKVIESESDDLRFDCMESSPEYPYPYGKICKINTAITEKYLLGYKNAGVFIDVFRIDGRGDMNQAKKLYSKLNKLQLQWLGAFSLKCAHSDNILKNAYWHIRHIWRKRKSARKWAEKIDSTGRRIKLDRTGNAQCSWIHEKAFPLEAFRDVTHMKFEDITIPCPIGYKQVLEIKYGDYMTPPPQNECVTVHSFSAFEKDPK